MGIYKRKERELFPSELATVETRGRYRSDRLEADEYRTELQRDVHRIIYSQAFRRLRHKTQVFYFPQNDHVTTRMDHVLFVASAARTVARSLGLNEDLAEAVGLAHDIGHTPFGHQGEEFMKGIIKFHPALQGLFPDFSHEIYGLRVVDKLGKLDREQPGLNLTWEVRDGIVSHCGEDFQKCRLEPTPNKEFDLEKIQSRSDAKTPATLEGCLVRLIDKVAYFGKDLEDALETEIITESDLPPKIKDELGDTNGQMIGNVLTDIINTSKDKVNFRTFLSDRF